MSPRPLSILALTTVVALALGCGPKAPPELPPVPTAEAPPPPKCEALSEKCAATADTRAKITNSELTFTPTTGWIYAQQSSATIAQASETGPAIAFTGIDTDPKDARKEGAAKDAALAELGKQIGLAPFKRKVNWRRPDENDAVGDIKTGRWQLDEQGVRGAKKGTVLVVVGTVAPGKGVVGVGFVPDDESGRADDILRSISSLGKAK